MAGVVLICSCAHSVRTSSVPMVRRSSKGAAAPNTSVAAVMKRQVSNAVDAGDGDARVRALRRQMSADPDNLQIRLELARHYESAGYAELAAEHYRLAAAHFPASAEVAVLLAKSLRSLNLAAEALKGLQVFENAHPESSWEVLCWLGILEDDAGDLKKAEASYRSALKLNAKSDSLHNNLGYNLLLQARGTEAVEEFRAALKLQPHSQVAQNNLGVALASEPKEAVLHMQSVSDPATAHNNLAAVLMEQGNYAEARKELGKALEYKGNHPAALANLQLISELDGKPFATPNRAPTRWKRFAIGVRKALLGVEEPRRDEAVKTASK